MKKIFTREILIGLILVISLSILFIGIDFLKGINVFKSSNLYYVAFKDVSGLAEAAPVTLNGMKVGQVTGMEYDYEHPGNVLVEVNLDSSVKLTKGTKFTKAVSLLGTGALAIEMAPGNSYVEAGSEMEGESQKDMMADISTEVLPQVVEMLPKLNSILAHVDSLAANPALQKTVTRLDAISANIELLTARLAATSQRIDPMVSNVNGLTKDLTAISADLKQLSAELKELPLSETMDNVNSTTANLKTFTGKLNGTDSSLGLLLNDRGLYDHIDSTVNSLDSLLIDLKAHPKKYVNFKLF